MDAERQELLSLHLRVQTLYNDDGSRHNTEQYDPWNVWHTISLMVTGVVKDAFMKQIINYVIRNTLGRFKTCDISKGCFVNDIKIHLDNSWDRKT